MNMKRILSVSILSFFLFGCGIHSNDPRARHYTASVTSVSNDICLKVQPENDELMTAIYIDEVGNNKNSFEKYNLTLPVSNDKCVSNFGYKFEVGKLYGFSVFLESPSKKKKGIQPYARIFGASFTLQDKNGKLEATPIN